MRKFILLVVSVFLISGCATYNSRNMIDVSSNAPEGMTFSYGLIACKNVSRILILRETNAGKGEAKNNIPNINGYFCQEVKNATVPETK